MKPRLQNIPSHHRCVHDLGFGAEGWGCEGFKTVVWHHDLTLNPQATPSFCQSCVAYARWCIISWWMKVKYLWMVMMLQCLNDLLQEGLHKCLWVPDMWWCSPLWCRILDDVIIRATLDVLCWLKLNLRGSDWVGWVEYLSEYWGLSLTWLINIVLTLKLNVFNPKLSAKPLIYNYDVKARY